GHGVVPRPGAGQAGGVRVVQPRRRSGDEPRPGPTRALAATTARANHRCRRQVFAASREAVLDEMPGAYKDLDEVMANQADLVEPVRRFLPLATYKGVDRPRRRSRSGWRPEEER